MRGVVPIDLVTTAAAPLKNIRCIVAASSSRIPEAKISGFFSVSVLIVVVRSIMILPCER